MTPLKLIPLIIVSILFSTFFLCGSSSAQVPDSKEKELFLVAQKAFDDGFYDVAIRYIEQFLQEYPQTDKRIQASLLLGQCYFFKTQYLKAYEIFQSLLAHREFQDATLYWLGETYLKGSDYNEAEKHFKQLLEVYPDSDYTPQGYYSLGWTYFEQEKYDPAREYFSKLIYKFPGHQLCEDAAFKLGEIEYNLASYETAIEFFKNYIFKYTESTRHDEAYFYMGESYYYQQDFLKAITYYARAMDISYDNKLIVMARVSMGWSYLKLKRPEQAKEYFDKAKTLAEEKGILSDDIYLGLATLYSETGENEKALAAYSELIEKFPISPRLAEGYLGRANIYYVLKNYPQAVLEYQLILDKFGSDAKRSDLVEKANFGLAWTYLKEGNIDASIQSFGKIINQTKSKTVKISALTQIADAYQDTDQFDKAIEVYDRILKDFPDSVYSDYVQFRQGIALLKLSKLDAATLSFQSLQANFPKSKYLKEVKYYIAVAYFKKGDWQTTVDYVKQYLADIDTANPDNLANEAHYILALSSFNTEDFKTALATFESIIQNYPQNTSLIQNSELGTAKSLYNLGQTGASLEKFKTIIQKYPKSEVAQEALIFLGNHSLETRDHTKARQIFEQFISEFPGSDKISLAHYELGQSLEAAEQMEEALNHYKLIEYAPDPEVYKKAKLAIADIFSREMDPQSAVATYEKIAQHSPEFKRDAYIKIAGLYEKNEMFDQALKAYKTALDTAVGLSKYSNAQLQFSIADTYEILNRRDKAVEEYLKISYLYPKETPWVIKSYLRVARIFEDSKKWSEANVIYKKIIAYKTNEAKYAEERLNWIKENALKGL